MKKTIAVAALLVGLAAVGAVYAQSNSFWENGMWNMHQNMFQTDNPQLTQNTLSQGMPYWRGFFGFTGSGIAVPATMRTNDAPFQVIDIYVGAVGMTNGATTTGSTDGAAVTENGLIIGGTLNMNGEQLELRNVVLGDTTVSADIYRDNELAGSLSLTRTENNKRTVWYGPLSLNGKSYDAYVFKHGMMWRRFWPMPMGAVQTVPTGI